MFNLRSSEFNARYFAVAYPRSGMLAVVSIVLCVMLLMGAAPLTRPVGDKASADIQKLRTAADAGDWKAARTLGYSYMRGTGGVQRDEAEAIKWFRKGAEKNDAYSMAWLGTAYHCGLGVEQDDAQAAAWYQKAAAGGNAFAMGQIGVWYMDGSNGLAKNEEQGAKWVRRGAAAADGFSMNGVGMLYLNGLGGLAQNEEEAIKWFRKAAAAGNPNAMSNLATVYEDGIGTKKDESAAQDWQKKAADVARQYSPATLVRTAHYDLFIDSPDQRMAADLAESLYQQLKQFFGVEPKARLAVRIFSRNSDYAIALEAAGDGSTFSAMYGAVNLLRANSYLPWLKTAYVCFDGCSPEKARDFLLHELTHQYHFLARALNQSPLSDFYTEGLAEHFAVHRWDGNHITIASVPVISNQDHARDALDGLHRLHHDSITALATDERTGLYDRKHNAVDPDTGVEYGEAWGLVSFLISAYPERYREWASLLDGGATPGVAWNKAFAGQSDSEMTLKYTTWLKRHRQPWLADSGSWDASGPHELKTHATPEMDSFALWSYPVNSLSADVKCDGPDEVSTGIVMMSSRSRFQVLEATSSGDLSLDTYADGKWMPDESIACAVHLNDPRSYHVEVRKSGDNIEVRLDGTFVANFAVDPDTKVGFAVLGCGSGGNGSFRSINVQPSGEGE
jgi:TPR repeat protein